jgi:hypothetical protein
MTPEIRTDVPIHVHPGSLGKEETVLNRKESATGTQAFNAASAGMTIAYEAFTAINDAEQALVEARPLSGKELKHMKDRSDVRMVNGVPTVMVISDAFIAATHKAWETTSPRIDDQKKQISGVITVLEQRMLAAVDDPARKTPQGTALAGELRNYIRGLSNTERFQFITQAIETDDKSTVAAVLHAQPFLSGIDEQQQTLLRSRAAQRWAPQDFDEFTAANKALAKVDAAHSALQARYFKVMDSRRSAKDKATEKLQALASHGQRK